MRTRLSSGPGWTLLAVCLAALIMPLSFSAGAIATPAIGHSLAGSLLALRWITNGFMLGFGSLLMAAGTLADRYGRKRLFISGVGLFAVFSLATGLASSLLWLDVLRGLQGVAAAAALAGGAAALGQCYQQRARLRAFSLLGTSFGVGLSLGPMLAGAIIAHYGWQAVFLSGAPVGALALVIALPLMSESRDPNSGRLDWAGMLSFTLLLVLLTWGMLQAPVSGWGSRLVLTLLGGALVCLLVFIAVERRSARPMLELSLFRYPRFVAVQLLPIATCFCFVVLLVLLPVRFIGIEGRSETTTGLMMIALSVPMLIVPALAALLTRWCSPGRLCGAGLLMAAGGLFWLGRIAPGADLAAVLLPMLLIGTGTGLPWGLMDGLSMSVVPAERAGMATGIFSTTRVAGEGITLALVSALFSQLVQHQLMLPGGLLPAATDGTVLIGQYLAAGDLTRAVGRAGALASPEHLLQIYQVAFRQLMLWLMAITVGCALIILLFVDQAGDRTGATVEERAG